MVLGDQVVFARLDVAEALGIWRHATGRVVDVAPATDGSQVVTCSSTGTGCSWLHRVAVPARRLIPVRPR